MIVGRLLAFGRPAMTDRQNQEIEPLIRQAAKIANEPFQQKNVQIIDDGIEPGLTADVDGHQIIQVLINLLLNAVEASPISGKVKITTEASGPDICVKVTDEGTRIPDEVRQHIFDAYYTTKPNGTGLGLAVSREIVVNHGGTLELESGNSGATFIMRLPVERSASDAA
jgi:signal transduction histidine kinase